MGAMDGALDELEMEPDRFEDIGCESFAYTGCVCGLSEIRLERLERRSVI